MRRAFAVLALVLMGPPAAAHAAFDAGAPLGEQGSVHLEIAGAPLVAVGVPLEARVRTDAQGPARLRLEPPDAPPRPWVDAAAPVPFVLDAPGEWGVTVEAGGASARFSVAAWPAARAFVEPAGEAASRGVAVEGRGARVAVQLVDAAHAALPMPEDAVARVRGPDGARRDVPLRADGVVDVPWSRGEWTIHVRAPSLGLDEGARPPVRMLVVGEDEAGVYGLEAREVPSGWWGALALGLAALTRGRPSRRACTR